MKRIRAMHGRRPIGWSPLFAHVLSAYHPEVQRREEGSEKRSKRGKIGGCVAGEGEFENGAGATGAPGKGPKKFEKYFLKREYRRCVFKILTC